MSEPCPSVAAVVLQPLREPSNRCAGLPLRSQSLARTLEMLSAGALDAVVIEAESVGDSLIRSAKTLVENARQRAHVVVRVEQCSEPAAALRLAAAGVARLLVQDAAVSREQICREILSYDATLPTGEPAQDALHRLGLAGSPGRLKTLGRELAVVLRSDLPVLITGETGVGKSMLAEVIHKLGDVRSGPFVVVDCACLPADLIDAELFGSVRGSYTGSVEDRKGLAAAAQGGTLFLDEIGELPIHLQGKLLRLVETGQIRPVGSSKSRKIDVRLVAATNIDLETAVSRGAFRRDLLFRLDLVRLALPALRDRPNEVAALAQELAGRQNLKGQPVTVDRQLLALFNAYPWPGNIRELKSVIDSSISRLSGSQLGIFDLPPSVVDRFNSSFCRGDVSEQYDLKRLEREAIAQALDKTQGRIAEAARLLGIGRTTLYRKLKESEPPMRGSKGKGNFAKPKLASFGQMA